MSASASTLTCAALRDGLGVLAEDMVYLQSQPTVRVWGTPAFVHLTPSARVHFPELQNRETVRLPNCNEKIAVPVPPERRARRDRRGPR